jgi:hypothetical protein
MTVRFGGYVSLLFPLAWPDNPFANLAQVVAESGHARRHAPDHGNIEMGRSPKPHYREVVFIAAGADYRIDAIAPEPVNDQIGRPFWIERSNIFQTHAEAATACSSIAACTLESASDEARETPWRAYYRDPLAPQLERAEQPSDTRQVLARRRQNAHDHAMSALVEIVAGTAMVDHHHSGFFRKWSGGACERTRVRTEDNVRPTAEAQRAINFGCTLEAALIVHAFERNLVANPLDLYSPARICIGNEQPQCGLGLPPHARVLAAQGK